MLVLHACDVQQFVQHSASVQAATGDVQHRLLAEIVGVSSGVVGDGSSITLVCSGVKGVSSGFVEVSSRLTLVFSGVKGVSSGVVRVGSSVALVCSRVNGVRS